MKEESSRNGCEAPAGLSIKKVGERRTEDEEKAEVGMKNEERNHACFERFKMVTKMAMSSSHSRRTG